MAGEEKKSVAAKYVWQSIGIIALVLLLGGYFYNAAVLTPAAERYQATLPGAVKELSARSKRLSETTDKLLLESTTASTEARLNNIVELKKQSNQLRRDAETFRAITASIKTWPLGMSPVYQDSLVHKSQGDAAVKQINEVLDEYDSLLDFLSVYYPTRQSVTTRLANFNQTLDLSLLNGTSAEQLEISKELTSQADRLAGFDPPRGFGTIAAAADQVHRRAADGFRSLAFAVDPPVEIAIDAAALQLEAVTEQNDALNFTELDKALVNSPVIKAVGDLPEVTGRFRI